MAVEVIDVAVTGRSIGAVQLQRDRAAQYGVRQGVTSYPGKLDFGREGRFDVSERVVCHLQVFHFRIDIAETQPDVRVLYRVGDQFRLKPPGLGIGIEYRARRADELECLVIVIVIIVYGQVEPGLAADQGGFQPGFIRQQHLFLITVFVLGKRGQQGTVEIACLYPAVDAGIDKQVVMGRVVELYLAGPQEVRGLVRIRGEKIERHARRENETQRFGAGKLCAVRIGIPDVVIQPVGESKVFLLNDAAEPGGDHQLLGQVKIDVSEQGIGICLQVRIRGCLQVGIPLGKTSLAGEDIQRCAADPRNKKRDSVIGVEHRTEEIAAENIQSTYGVRQALGRLHVDIQVIGAGDPAHALSLAFQAYFLGEPVHIGLPEIDELRHRGIAHVQ